MSREAGTVLSLREGKTDAYVRSRFDEVARRFRAVVEADDYRMKAVLRALRAVQSRRVLDLGCGKGRFGRRLAALGAEVVGLDGSRGMLDEARGIGRVQGSAARLPFGPGTFDAVVAIEVLEHLEYPAAAIAEAAAVLRPGGVLVVLDKNAMALDSRRPWLPAAAVKRIDEIRGRWMYPLGAPFRERWFRAGALARELSRHFAEVQVEFLLAPAEARWAVFRRVPAMRRMVAWVARRGA